MSPNGERPWIAPSAVARSNWDVAQTTTGEPWAGHRVLLLNWRDPSHSLAGGAEQYAWELARGLVEKGASVELWCSHQAGLERRATREGVRVRRYGGPLTYYPRTLLRLLRRRHCIDAVIDSHCGIPAFSPCATSRSTPTLLLVHHVHQDQYELHLGPRLARLGRWLEAVAMPRVYARATTVAVSPSTATQMRSRLGWRGPIQLAPPGHAGAAPVVAPRQPRRIAVLGRLVVHKRVDLVLRAVALVPGVHVDVVGDGPERPRLAALAHDLDIQDRITLHGYVSESEKSRLIAGAGLHVCVSHAEGWGLAVIEAAAQGVPTLARDAPGLRDSVIAGRTGWLVSGTAGQQNDLDPAALATALATALHELDDPGRRDQMGEECQSWADRFTWNATRRVVLDRLGDLLGIPDDGAAPPAPGAAPGGPQRTARTRRMKSPPTTADAAAQQNSTV